MIQASLQCRHLAMGNESLPGCGFLKSIGQTRHYEFPEILQTKAVLHASE